MLIKLSNIRRKVTGMLVIYTQPDDPYVIAVREFCMNNHVPFSQIVRKLFRYAVENDLLEKIANEVEDEK